MILKSVPEAQQRRARLWCAFTTPSFAIAYVSSEWNDPKPKVRLMHYSVSGAGY